MYYYLICTGNTLGSIITLAVSGFLCSTNIDGGWPLVFYSPGMYESILNDSVYLGPWQYQNIIMSSFIYSVRVVWYTEFPNKSLTLKEN